jgi:hypothetical protein
VRASGAAVVLLGDTPHARNNVTACLTRNRTDVPRCVLPVGRAVSSPAQRRAERTAAVAEGATVVDPTTWLCTATKCPVIVGKRLVYRDWHHLTTAYSAWLAPVLREQLLAALR